MMNFDEMLKSVTAEARALGIPVADTIRPQVQRNTRAKKRFGQIIPVRAFSCKVRAVRIK